MLNTPKTPKHKRIYLRITLIAYYLRRCYQRNFKHQILNFFCLTPKKKVEGKSEVRTKAESIEAEGRRPDCIVAREEVARSSEETEADDFIPWRKSEQLSSCPPVLRYRNGSALVWR